MGKLLPGPPKAEVPNFEAELSRLDKIEEEFSEADLAAAGLSPYEARVAVDSAAVNLGGPPAPVVIRTRKTPKRKRVVEEVDTPSQAELALVATPAVASQSTTTSPPPKVQKTSRKEVFVTTEEADLSAGRTAATSSSVEPALPQDHVAMMHWIIGKYTQMEAEVAQHESEKSFFFEQLNVAKVRAKTEAEEKVKEAKLRADAEGALESSALEVALIKGRAERAEVEVEILLAELDAARSHEADAVTSQGSLLRAYT